MDKWFESKLSEIGKLDYYKKPEKSRGLKLDANENLALKKDFIKKIAIKAAEREDLREYPLHQVDDFYLQLSKYTKIDKKNLAIGNGSDQIIDLILSVFGKEKRVTTFTPTFSYFIDRCLLYSIKIDKIPLLQDKSIIIDEAYVEFASYSFYSETIKSQNIILLRTLSKAFGLAGARLGYCIANEDFSRIFKTIIQYPYAINNISLNIGSEILRNSKYID